jgi:hypothetical protein
MISEKSSVADGAIEICVSLTNRACRCGITGSGRKRDALCLCRVVGIHGVYLGCRLRGDVRLRARTKRDVERKPITLQQAPPPTARMLMSPAVLTTLIAAFVLAPAIALAHSGHAETTD